MQTLTVSQWGALSEPQTPSTPWELAPRTFTDLQRRQRAAMRALARMTKTVIIEGFKYRTLSETIDGTSNISFYPVNDADCYLAGEIRARRRRIQENELPKTDYRRRLAELKHEKYGKIKIGIDERIPIVSLGLTGLLDCPIEVYTFLSRYHDFDGLNVRIASTGHLQGHPHSRNGGQCFGNLGTMIRDLPISAETMPLKKALLIESIGVFNRADMFNGRLSEVLSSYAYTLANNPQNLAPNWNRKTPTPWLREPQDAETGQKVTKGEIFSRLLAWYVTGDWKNWKAYHPKHIIESRQTQVIVTYEAPSLENEVA